MFKKLKFSSWIMLILFALAVVFSLIFYLGNVQPGTAGTPVEEPVVTDEFLIMAYVYFGIALFTVILFSLYQLLQEPKAGRNLLIGIGVFIVIAGISYLSASGKPVPDFNNPSNTSGTVKGVDTGLIAAYIFGGLAIAGVIYTEISGMLKSG